MKPLSITRTRSAGSQIEGERLEYMNMPKGMEVYEPPRLPEAEQIAAAPEGLSVLQEVADALVRSAGSHGNETLDITALTAAERAVVNQVLGEGEVSAIIDNGDGVRVSVQESLLAGVWRLITTRGDAIERDAIEVGAVPALFAQAAMLDWGAERPAWQGPLPPNVLNAPSLVEEVRDRSARWEPGQEAHVINLTLLPVTMEDIGFLDHEIGTGSLLVLSRGYGNCRITNTRMRYGWRVVYYNSMDKVILNTVEITDIPQVMMAAPEDIRDAHERLVDLLHILRED